jgi:hypothetical protein
MARPRRLGTFNALDELLPGPESDADQRRLEAVSRTPRLELEPEPERSWDRQWEQPEERVEEPRRGSGFNALDELLPGPLAARRRLQLVPDRSKRRGRGESKHLSAYNPLDGLESDEPPRKARVSLRVSAELLDAARNASAYLSHEQERVTLGELAEEALRAELHRLAAEHNSGRPFPPREDDRGSRRPTR